uniref:SJCHGC05180 protein n=1 Tax=Schistosoma japonicum TaxID=6182 RepID=Q5BSB5_SCHJA|nr:SJCHGC05180 protein [Schistosoma japonicum]
MGRWNVHTMLKTGGKIKIAMKMKRYHLKVIRIGETHLLQAKQQRLSSGKVLLYTGHE